MGIFNLIAIVIKHIFRNMLHDYKELISKKINFFFLKQKNNHINFFFFTKQT